MWQSACHLADVTQLAGAVPSRRTAGGVGNACAEGLGVGWQGCGSGWGNGKAGAGGRGPCQGTAAVTQAKPEVCGWSCLGPGLGRGSTKPQQNHLRACVHLVAFSGALPTHAYKSAILSSTRTQGPSRPFPLPSPPVFMAPSAPYTLTPTTPSTPALRGPAGIEASSGLPTTTTRALQKPPGHAASRPASPIARRGAGASSQLVPPGGHSRRPPGTSPQPRQPPCDALNPVQRESPHPDTPPRSMGWGCSFTQALGGRATASWGPCHHQAVSPCLWQALPVLCATGTATLVTLGPAGPWHGAGTAGTSFPCLYLELQGQGAVARPMCLGFLGCACDRGGGG